MLADPSAPSKVVSRARLWGRALSKKDYYTTFVSVSSRINVLVLEKGVLDG